ncbi:MAG: GNAT family N-acetyltransferase, partial [Pedobacter sp.]
MEYTTIIKAFEKLSTEELYQIMKLRIEVFIIEQQCLYQDADDKDQKCHHLMLIKDETLVAYARLVPAGLSFPEVSIGRVITSAGV